MLGQDRLVDLIWFIYRFGQSWLLNIRKYMYRGHPREARPHSIVGSMCDSRARGPELDTQSPHIFSFLLPLIQEGQLSVSGESVCMKYWLTA